jgi:hypothetical protein
LGSFACAGPDQPGDDAGRGGAVAGAAGGAPVAGQAGAAGGAPIAGQAGAAGGGATGGQGGAGGPASCPADVRDAGASDGAVGGGAAVSAACGECETAHATNDLCPATLLTATFAQDPDTGNQLAVGWGLDTLSTPEARAAGAALLHCLNTNACSTDSKNLCAGDNPELGCFCGGGVTPEACLSGAGVHGPCVSEYEAAATVTPGGPPAGSSVAAFALFVASAAFDPTGPIGLADMIERCAVADPCPICQDL